MTIKTQLNGLMLPVFGVGPFVATTTITVGLGRAGALCAQVNSNRLTTGRREGAGGFFFGCVGTTHMTE